MECYLLGAFNIVSFVLGYLYCHYRISTNTTISYRQKNNNNRETSQNNQIKIDIDESKFVLGIDTSNMEKKYDSLGSVSHSNDSINNSISKLKQLKR